MQSLSEIGITLLLFMLGLEMRLKDLRSVGKTAVYTGIGQIVFTSGIGFFIALALGFNQLVSFYVAIALTFSSTIIIVKLLSDKKDLNSLYGKISVGFLLVQDFVAIIALILLSGFNSGAGEITVLSFLMVLLKAVVLIGWVIVFSKTLLPKVVGIAARSTEILFLFSLAWAFGLAVFVSSPIIGFSIEIGGFLAGLALANSAENFQIVSKVRSLRDFFITIFFVMLGMKMVFGDFGEIVFPAFVFSIFVLIGNPIIVMAILGMMGYKRRTSFLAGLTVAQISEFSLIVVFMGNKIGHLPSEVVSLITLVGAITFVLSTYLIMHGNKLYRIAFPFLKIFERERKHETKIVSQNFEGHVILIGANRMGESIIDALLHNKEQVVVVDFDPEVIDRLKSRDIACFYGDIADPEIQELIGIYKSRIIISTVPDVEDNLSILEALKRRRKRVLTIFFALETFFARALYKEGANYVVLPHLAGGRHLAKIIADKNHLELIEEYKAKDMRYFK